jgi:hypothetical protein
MPLLRFAYVLALALWLGGMIVLGAVVAPALFATLPALEPESGRVLAGGAFSVVLSRFHYLSYGAGIVLLVALVGMALLGPRPRSFAIRLAATVLMLGVAAYSGVIVSREIDSIQRQVNATAASTPSASIATDTRWPRAGASVHKVSPLPVLPSSLPANDPRRVRFEQLHQLSTRLMMFNIAAALVLLGLEAREASR